MYFDPNTFNHPQDPNYKYNPRPKVGSWTGQITTLKCFVKPQFRKSWEIFDRLDQAFLAGELSDLPTVPPRSKATFRMQSRHLGVWAYAINIRLDYDRAVYNRNYHNSGPEWLKQEFVEAETNLRIALWIIKMRIKGFFALPGTDELMRNRDNPFEICGTQDHSVFKGKAPDWSQRQMPVGRAEPGWWKPFTTPVQYTTSSTENGNSGEIVVRRNAMGELPLISWPLPIPFKYEPTLGTVLQDSFYQYKNPGEGVVVYLMDSGLNPFHPDFQDLDPEGLEWIETSDFPIEKWSDDPEVGFHGTIMGAKIKGRLSGIAQSVGMVVVPTLDGYGSSSRVAMLDAMLKIYDHIKKHNSHLPCIISCSLGISIGHAVGKPGSYFAELLDIFDRQVEDLMLEFQKLRNVIFVSSGGNLSPGTRISNYPQALGARKDLTRFLVVGSATGHRGHNLRQFNTSFVNMVWAPADRAIEITFPDPRIPQRDLRDDMYYIIDDGGTSIATAMVSGVLAMRISHKLRTEKDVALFARTPLQQTVDNAILEIKRDAYARKAHNSKGQMVDIKEMPLIWTGMPFDLWPEPDRTQAAEIDAEAKKLIKSAKSKIYDPNPAHPHPRVGPSYTNPPAP
ncbi:Secreted subtilisin-like serine protease sub4 [Orbilia blumenaviensis]|uniref:Secreted subtilisin-like serine protease sub4 n=1 Tax=Orbilia blumenaviensis TaxID=1796055 RepID=A0AAV9U0T1_9PEZI